MKIKNLKSTILLSFILFFVLIGCTNEDIAAPTNAKINNVESELKDEYSKALVNVLQFQNLVSDNNTKSTTTLKVVSYNIEKINLQNNSRVKSIS